MKVQHKQVISEKLKPRKLGLWKGKVWVSPDFDKEDEEINEMFYDGDPLGKDEKQNFNCPGTSRAFDSCHK